MEQQALLYARPVFRPSSKASEDLHEQAKFTRRTCRHVGELQRLSLWQATPAGAPLGSAQAEAGCRLGKGQGTTTA